MTTEILHRLDREFEKAFPKIINIPVKANVIFLEDGYNVEFYGAVHGELKTINKVFQNGDPFLKSLFGAESINKIINGKSTFQDTVKYMVQNLTTCAIRNIEHPSIRHKDTEILLTFYRNDNTIFKMNSNQAYELNLNIKFRR